MSHWSLTDREAKPVRSVDSYRTDGAVMWMADLPRHPAVTVAGLDSDPEPDAPLLSVDRVPRIAAPQPPADLSPWIVGDWDDSNAEPKLRESMPNPQEEAEDLEPPGEIAASFAAWRAAWDLWAVQDRADGAVRTVYQDLFSNYTRADSRSEELELIVGVGCLSWHPTGHPAVKRHLFTQSVLIHFDDESGRLSVLSGGSQGLRFEIDMLDPSHVANPAHVDAVRALARDYLAHPLHRDEIAALATRVVHALDADGAYLDEESASAPSPSAAATFAPAVILRRRTQQGLLEMLRTISAQLAASGTVPEGLLPLVDPDHTPATSSEHQEGAVVLVDDDPFLPLPVNDTQLQILRRVDSHAQTLIQGPPGTGKTHTAAALLSHLLAQGKRVLVTAHTDRALQEVREKLPEAIQPLCVAVVGTSREDMADLQLAAARIGAAATDHDSARETATMNSCLASIDRLRRERAGLHTRLMAAREHEITVHQQAGAQGTLASIAERHEGEAAAYSWLGEDLTVNPEVRALITSAEIEEWRRLLLDDRVTVDEAESQLESIDLSAIPDPDALAALVNAEIAAVARSAASASLRSHAGFEAVRRLDRQSRQTLAGRVTTFAAAIADLAGRGQTAADAAVAEVLAGNFAAWEAHHQHLDDLLTQASAQVERLSGGVDISVQTLDVGPLTAMAASVREFLAAGNKLKTDAAGMPRPGPLSPKVVKQSQPLWDLVRVNGLPPATTPQLDAFLAWASVRRVLQVLDRAWPAGAALPPATLAQSRLEWHRNEANRLRAVLELAVALEAESSWLVALGIPRPDWADNLALSALARLPEAADSLEDLATATAPIDDVEALVARPAALPKACSTLTALRDSVRTRNVAAYELTYRRIAGLAEVYASVLRRDELAARLETTAPWFRTAIATCPSDARWVARIADFDGAWAWAGIGAWVRSQTTENVNALQSAIVRIEVQIRTQVEILAATRAWNHAASPLRITGTMRADLAQYAYLVGKLGAGTGKYAAQRRAEIRQSMDRCRPAVPVWIMPIYRIAEQLTINADMFDIVIVDEASQAGVEASFLQYLAPKIVVIGDDRQVSPSGVGIDQQQLRDLATQYLADDRSRATWQDPQRSLFDEAKERFRGMLTLTEHRRCVPEIIGFSNRVAYEPHGIRLVPVRQYGSDRLDPIKPVFLLDGYVRGTSAKVNPVEIEAIVEQIEKCIADPRYDGLTFGVISLLGAAQANMIQKALMDRIPAEEWAARKLRCGDSADFQGSERDVMFLSMVAANDPEHRNAPLTRDMYVQRYNVAASRAKDQMWVFHSVPLSSLGNPNDMRFALLDYCYGVTSRTDSATGTTFGTVPENEGVDPFDSLFEQRVYNRIVDRGYQVFPQFEVQGARIDLVVLGGGARLAVECDGDFWHGPAQYEHDLARQRDLERCGWTFFRIRESAFNVDRANALGELWTMLGELDIHPSGWKPDADAEPSPAAGTESTPAPPVPAPVLPAQPVAGNAGGWAQEPREPAASPPPSGNRTSMPAQVTPARAERTPAPTRAQSAPSQPAKGGAEAAAAQLFLARPTVDVAPIASPAGSKLAPYRTWTARRLDAIETAEQSAIIDTLCEIVAAEGPIITLRAYQTYIKATGGQRVGKEAKRLLNQATSHALRRGRLKQLEDSYEGLVGKTLYLPGAPHLIVRELGPRTIFEVPRSEIRELARGLGVQGRSGPEVKRIVLESLGLTRLTEKTSEFLDECLQYLYEAR